MTNATQTTLDDEFDTRVQSYSHIFDKAISDDQTSKEEILRKNNLPLDTQAIPRKFSLEFEVDSYRVEENEGDEGRGFFQLRKLKMSTDTPMTVRMMAFTAEHALKMFSSQVITESLPARILKILEEISRNIEENPPQIIAMLQNPDWDEDNEEYDEPEEPVQKADRDA